jgi:peptidoglycan hydrolase-like protein with peptidoglycan-binding domain
VRRFRSLLILVCGSLLCTGLGYAAALTMAPATDTGAGTPTGPVTAPVELRKITSAVIARGDANFADPVALVVRPAAPLPIVTAAPKHRGEWVDAGEVALEVAGRPVIALAGGLPAYRDLAPGDVGPDVAQLETALAAIGLDPGDVDDEFTSYTGAAVADLYERLGYEPATAAETGSGAPDGASPRDGTTMPMSEVTFVPTLPRRVDRAPARRGRTLPKRPMLLSGSELIVSIGLTAADRDLLRRGMRAVVDVPGWEDVRARLGSVTATATGGRTSVRLPRLSAERQHAVQGANVKVTVPLESTKRPVLVVPLAALSTDAAGTVRVVRVAMGGARDTIKVELGLSAEGFVEVRAESENLAEGDRVVVGE